MTDQMQSSEVQEALNVARALAQTGVPIFLLEADPNAKTGYRTPKNWQHTRPDPTVVDRWNGNMAIAAVCGVVFDVIDIDPRHGGSELALDGAIDFEYARASTPSGGLHLWIKALNMRKSQGFIPGIDYQGGDDKGYGRGFVFIPPTIRESKVTGQYAHYRWLSPPNSNDVSRLMTDSGPEALRNMIRASTTSTKGNESSDLSVTQKGTKAEQIGTWLTEGAPQGFQHTALIDIVWDSVWYGEELRTTYWKWKRVVDLSEQDLSNPWTDEDFKEHYKSARRKLGNEGTIIPLRLDATDWQIGKDLSADSRRKLKLIKASEVEPEETRWLWEDRLALGTLAVLGGRPGTGKSTFAYTFAASVTKGSIPGNLYGHCRDVFLASTEDDFTRVIVPRLMASGADLNRVHKMLTVSNDVENEVSFPHDLEQLAEGINKINPALVIVDPLISRLGSSLNTHKDSEVRQALEPLVKLIEDKDTVILGLMHFSKAVGAGGDALSALMGSVAFGAVARSAHLIFLDPDAPNDEASKGKRIFLTEKNNLGPSGVGLPNKTFFIETAFVHDSHNKQIKTSKIKWGDDDDRTSSELIQAGKNAGKPDDDHTTQNKRVLASMWLKNYLQTHPGSDKKDIEREAVATSHAVRTLQRAIQDAQTEGWLRKEQPVHPGPTFYYLVTESE